MIVELRMVKKLEGNALGRTKFLSGQRALIEISMGKNKDLLTFGVVLFHELLHVWTNIMKTNGAELDFRKEHKFIYAMHSPLVQKILLMRRK